MKIEEFAVVLQGAYFQRITDQRVILSSFSACFDRHRLRIICCWKTASSALLHQKRVVQNRDRNFKPRKIPFHSSFFMAIDSFTSGVRTLIVIFFIIQFKFSRLCNVRERLVVHFTKTHTLYPCRHTGLQGYLTKSKKFKL